MSEPDSLDALLDSALDDYSALESPSSTSSLTADTDQMAKEFAATDVAAPSVPTATVSTASTATSSSPKAASTSTSKSEARASRPSAASQSSSSQSSSSSSSSSTSATSSERVSDADLAAQLRALAQSVSEDATGESDATFENLSEDEILERVLTQLDKEPEMGDAVGSLVQQIMSKELLYEPMIELRDAYPTYFASSEAAKASKADLDRFQRQHSLIKRICIAYETTPIDYEKLTELMAAVQEQGQPPSSIIASVAPDAKLDEKGVPQISPEQCTIV